MVGVLTSRFNNCSHNEALIPMPFMYPVKRVFRNWKLFTALLIGIALAATFFACIDVKANLAAKQSLDQQLKSVNVDMEFSANLNLTEVNQAQSNISSIDGVKSVDVVSRFNEPAKDLSSNYTTYVQIVSFPNSSEIYNDWTNKPAGGIGVNQTYVISDTTLASKVSVGDNITTEFMFPTPKQDNFTTIYMNLTVAGFADLTDTGYSLVSGNSFLIPLGGSVSSSQIYNARSDSMIIGDNTLQEMWSPMANRTVDTTFLINVDRTKLISPWNIPASANNVNTVASDIQNDVLSKYQTYGYVNNNLGVALDSFSTDFQTTVTEFIALSLPVFFVSWYLASTVSDVSFNMRRREIGLLSTKGLSSGQIQRMFLAEALTIGCIGGAVGVVGGLVLNQIFTGGFNFSTLFGPQSISPETMVFTVIFGIAIGFISIFSSARRASKLPTVEALRDYMPTDADQPYRKRLPWVAAIIGTFTIVVLFLGINVPTTISNLIFSGGYFLSVAVTPLTDLYLLLMYIGPLLFFWGVTKLLIQNSLKFQQLATQFSRVTGDLGALAAKNVRRNPARIAAVAFLIAFIIGYGVQVAGQTASQQDYLVRQVQSSVGADISIGVVNATKAPQILADILGNVTGIANSTMVCKLDQPQAGTVVETIDPASFLATAYYENDWFSGASVQQAFKEMETNNMTIILEQRVAQEDNLKVGDTIAIDFPSGARTLTIVALFGPQIPSNEVQSVSGGQAFPAPIIFSNPDTTWSYVPRNLFNMSSPFSDAYKLESFDTTILLKLNPGVNGTAVAEKIRSLNLEIYGVTSFAEQWQQSQNSNDQSTFYTLQVLDFQNLGVIFAVLSASVGMVLIAVVSLSERSREATLMSVRGLSYRQLVWMFLAENLAVITFSVLLGLSVGLIIDYGTITAANVGTTQLVYPHFVFPLSVIETVACYIALIYASTIGAILIMSRKYVTKLERMVRLR